MFCSVTHAEVQEDFFALLFRLCQVYLGNLEGQNFLFAFTTCGERHLLLGNHTAVLHNFVHEVEIRERCEIVHVLKFHLHRVGLLIHTEEVKLNKFVRRLHFLEFRTLMARCGNNTVRAEVSLVGAREVVTCAKVVDALRNFLGFVNRLVHPVPNTSTNRRITILNRFPIFGQVTNSITHGVRIFADEHGLVEVVGVTRHPVHTRIHL